MIITCENCNKKFDVNDELIPKIGRLLQCSSCDHKWYFKNKIKKEEVLIAKETLDNDNGIIPINIKDEKPQLNKPIKEEEVFEENLVPKKDENSREYKDNPKILSKIFIFIITFIALVTLVDTFKFQISKVVPNIEFLLYNLFESIKDIVLFSKDLF
tara:strand:+ start:86 stop:556 length:471 start_codon:yes stop_codon:yes gene_type:complete